MASPGKRTALTTAEKIEILEQLKNGQSKKAVAEKRKIAVRTVQKISKDEEQIRQLAAEGVSA